MVGRLPNTSLQCARMRLGGRKCPSPIANVMGNLSAAAASQILGSSRTAVGVSSSASGVARSKRYAVCILWLRSVGPTPWCCAARLSDRGQRRRSFALNCFLVPETSCGAWQESGVFATTSRECVSAPRANQRRDDLEAVVESSEAVGQGSAVRGPCRYSRYATCSSWGHCA